MRVLSAKDFVLLTALMSGPKPSLDLTHLLQRTFWLVSYLEVFLRMRRLRDRGFVTWVDGYDTDGRTRTFKITPLGRRAYTTALTGEPPEGKLV